MGEGKLSGKWYHLPWKEGSLRGLNVTVMVTREGGVCFCNLCIFFNFF